MSIGFVVLALCAAGCGGGGGGSTGADTGPPPSAGTLSLAWNSNTEADLAGYMIHYGTSPGVYGTTIDAGLANRSGGTTSFVLTRADLLKGHTYYLAIQAYNSSGAISPMSNEATGVAK